VSTGPLAATISHSIAFATIRAGHRFERRDRRQYDRRTAETPDHDLATTGRSVGHAPPDDRSWRAQKRRRGREQSQVYRVAP
jgi:hypothetical protein